MMPQGCGCGTGGGGTGSCADVGSCLSEMTEGTPCLDVTGTAPDQTLTPVISPQSGNLLQCTPEGLLVAGEVTPTFCSPPDLIEPFWIASHVGPYAPWGSEAYLDVLLAHNIDGIHTRAWAAPDGVFVWGISSDDSAASYYLNISYQDREDQTPAAPPAAHGDIDSNTWRNALSPAGNSSGLMPNNDDRQVLDPDNLDTTDGGWWGWGAASFSPMTLQQALDRIACRFHVFLDLRATNNFSLTEQVPLLISQMQAQGRIPGVIPVVNWASTDPAASLIAAGFVVGARVTENYTGDGSDLVAAGFTYAVVDPDQVDPAVLASLYASALQVVTDVAVTRHYKVAEAIGDGASGILSKQPVYARAYNDDPATTYFKRDRMLYDYNRHFGTSTERGDVDHGYAFNGQPGRVLYIPSPTTSEIARQRELLLGDLDIPDPNNWEMSWTVSVPSSQIVGGNTQVAGVFFGNTVDITPWPARATADEIGQINGYQCTWRISTGADEGNLYVIKYTNGVASILFDSDSVGTSKTQRFGLQVSPSSFTFVNYTAGWTVNQSVTINDPDYRGPYVWAVAVTNMNVDAPMGARFRNFALGPPT